MGVQHLNGRAADQHTRAILHGSPTKKRKRDTQESSHTPSSKHDRDGLVETPNTPGHAPIKPVFSGQDHADVPNYTAAPFKPERRLPELPPVYDKKLLSAVFTHRGVLDAGNSLQLDQCYDRFEFLGDAYLEVISTRILFNSFPIMTSGRLATVRESLINNTTLGKFAIAYEFDKRVSVRDEVFSQSKHPLKVFADVFEAYVAAIILDSPEDGFATAENWLRDLWAPQLEVCDKGPVSKGNAKQDLSKKIGGKGVKIEYVDDRPPEPAGPGRQHFFVSVKLTGWGLDCCSLGSGVGLSKPLAGSEAALKALENVPIIEEIAAVKQTYDTEQRLKKEREI